MEAAIGRQFAELSPLWNERQRRLWAASEAQRIGYGGVSAVALARTFTRGAGLVWMVNL